MSESIKSNLAENINNYFSRTKKSSAFLGNSINISYKEIKKSSISLLKNPGPSETAQLIQDLVGSGAWIGNSYLKLLLTIAGIKREKRKLLTSSDWHFLVDMISKKIPIEPKSFTHQDIFQSIYTELDYAHNNPSYQSALTPPKIFPTIVLISGVFNELYKTAAFERGVQHAGEVCGLKYLVADTHGFKSSGHNTKLIEETLFNYHRSNPDEKLWIIAYSKGGIDSLHFLRKNKEWAEKNMTNLQIEPIEAGHAVNMQDASKFNLAVSSFIKKCSI